jgi:tetratricopeptide (TPR) repeat protein
VAKTVESALFRSSPGKVFTIGVLTAMPAFAISAKAATLGATAAKGSTAAKAAAATGLVGAILGPLFSIFGMWVGFRMNIEAAQTDRERDHIAGFYRGLIASILGFAAVYFLLMCYARQLMESHHQVFIGLVIGLALAYTIAIAALSMWSLRKRREILATMTVREMATDPTRSVLEYRSSFRLMGLPFIHIRIGDRLAPPVKAWIAMGGSAFGVLFAFGGLAVAPVSIGGCAVGLFSFGGLAIGALALGGFGLGVWCFGGMALGWQAFGGCALAWDSAFGGVAIARDFALGGLAHAAQVNNDAAGRHLGGFAFFRYSQLALPYVAWMNLLWIVPMLGCRGVIARRAKRPATVALVGCFAALTLRAATPQEPASIPVTQSDRTESSSSERFDDLVRDDFFAGTLKGDRASFDRAMKLCEDALAKNPKHAQALVWHGSGLLYLSGLSFQSNDVPKGLELWRRGLKEMDGAVALEPDNVAVLIPRAATLLPISKYVPNPDESRQLLKTGVADYEKVLELQKAYFGKLSVHAQGELLFGIADGWFRLGEIDRSQKYLRRIAQELPGSNYAVRASDWLQTTDTAALQKKSAAMSCVGCHTP